MTAQEVDSAPSEALESAGLQHYLHPFLLKGEQQNSIGKDVDFDRETCKKAN